MLTGSQGHILYLDIHYAIMLLMRNYMPCGSMANLSDDGTDGTANGTDYIDKMELKGNAWGNEVIIFAMTQMIGKDIVTYVTE